MRTWTLPEANAVLPEVSLWIVESQSLMRDLRDVREQLTDLEIVWGDAIDDPSCPDRDEIGMHRAKAAHLEEKLNEIALRFHALGCEVKDVAQGLVDFRGLLGRQEVQLCWKQGESAIRHWHTMESGFLGRKPIPGT